MCLRGVISQVRELLVCVRGIFLLFGERNEKRTPIIYPIKFVGGLMISKRLRIFQQEKP